MHSRRQGFPGRERSFCGLERARDARPSGGLTDVTLAQRDRVSLAVHTAEREAIEALTSAGHLSEAPFTPVMKSLTDDVGLDSQCNADVLERVRPGRIGR